MMNKYKITNETMIHNGITLYRIERFYTKTLGGWIESQKNLSSEGNCFIYDDAMVFGDAVISGDAEIKGNAQIYGNATVTDSVAITGNAQIYGNARVTDSARITDNAKIYGDAKIKDSAKVYDNAVVCGQSVVEKNAKVYGYAFLDGNMIITNNDYINNRIESSWSNVDSVANVTLFIEPDRNKFKIYANGKHQVPIIVHLDTLNKNKEHIKVDSEQLLQNISLYFSGKNTLDDDEKKIFIGDYLIFSTQPDNYVFPEAEHYLPNLYGSVCIIYVSCDFYLNNSIDLDVENRIKIYLKYNIKGKEYTTESSSEITKPKKYKYVSLHAKQPYIFKSDDLDQSLIKNPKIEKSVAGYDNSILYKYYIKFSPKIRHHIKNVDCEQDDLFHYLQKGNYKGFSTTTDNLFKQDDDAYYTKEFIISSDWSISVTSKNHEETGICFWCLRVWYGALWLYNEKSKPCSFILYDQYGNQAKLDAVTIEDEQLTFNF